MEQIHWMNFQKHLKYGGSGWKLGFAVLCVNSRKAVIVQISDISLVKDSDFDSAVTWKWESRTNRIQQELPAVVHKGEISLKATFGFQVLMHNNQTFLSSFCIFFTIV